MSDIFHPRRASKADLDSDILAQLGKKQVLKRRFGFWSLFGFAVCELITWETVLALFSQGFNNGGPAGLVYGFIIAWSSTLSVYTVISELASMAPIAGGQYYWVYMLAPKYKIFCSYIVGWLTTMAWVATVAIETIFAGTILQGLIILNYPDYAGTLWQGTLFAYLTIVVSIFINAGVPGALPKIEVFIIFFHLAGFVAIIAVLWKYTNPINTPHFVFATALNEGGWSTQGLSYCIGFLGNVATFVGADASVHLAEEVSNAAKNIPRAITASMCMNGLIGFVMMITTLFCLGDVDTVLGTATGYPFIQIFYDSVKSLKGATTMGAVVLILTWCCAIGITTTASRMTWSFARDQALPFSRFLKKVDRRTQVPIIAVLVVCLLAMLLQLIYVGSYTAFNDIVSLTITGFYGSYFLPAAFLLYHRLKGNIAPRGSLLSDDETFAAPQRRPASPPSPPPYDPEKPGTEVDHRPEPVAKKPDRDSSDPEKPMPPSPGSPPSLRRGSVQVAQAQLQWGPWHIPEPFGTINNAYACTYMVFVIFWSVWPPDTPVTAASMNYSIVVTAGVVVFSCVWYVVRGRREYKGPRIDDEVARVMRVGSVVAI